MPVVMRCVLVHDRPQVPRPGDHSIRSVTSARTVHPALGIGVHSRRLDRGADDPGASGLEDGVEREAARAQERLGREVNTTIGKAEQWHGAQDGFPGNCAHPRSYRSRYPALTGNTRQQGDAMGRWRKGEEQVAGLVEQRHLQTPSRQPADASQAPTGSCNSANSGSSTS
jgi:hypothetical protein